MSFTDDLRSRVRRHMSACPTCGSYSRVSMRAIARETGLSPSTISRFFDGKKDLVSSAIDALVAWCEKREAASGGAE